MTTSQTNPSRAAPGRNKQSTGNKYSSVKELMKGEQMPASLQEKVQHLLIESRVATQMAQLRHYANITQEQMADALGVKQPAISKLEAGKDDDITLFQIKQYAQITGQRISMWFGKPFTATEAVKNHADGLKYWLDQLAELANQNEGLQAEIKGFVGNAFYSLFNIIALCNAKLPVDADDEIADIRIEIVTGKKVIAPTEKPPQCSKEEALAVA